MSDLPIGWSSAPLRDLGDLALGKMLDAKRTAGQRRPYLRNVNVRWGRFDVSDVLAMPFEDDEIERFRVRAGDLLICEGGEPGRAAVWSAEDGEHLYQKALHRFRSNGAVLPQWVMYCLRYDALRGHLSQHFSGTTIKHLTGVALARYEIPVPPLNEQRRVVAKLEALLARSRNTREALDALPALLERFRQSMLAAALRGDLTADWRAQNRDVEPASNLLARIRVERRRRWEAAELERMASRGKPPKDDRWKAKYEEPAEVDTSELPELPEGWCWTSADAVVAADIVYGIVQPGPQVENGVPYVRGMDIENGQILEDQLRRTHPDIAARYERASLKGGDVLLGIIRATKVAVVPPSLTGANITQGTARFRPAVGIDTRFLAGWLASPSAQSRLHAMYRGIDMPGLNLRDVRRLPVPLAPIQEQAEVCRLVAASIDRYSRLRSAHREAHARLSVLDSALLAKAFRGELVPQDPSDEPASALLARIRAERAAAATAPTKKGRRTNTAA